MIQRVILAFLLVFPLFGLCQKKSFYFPKDTTYSVWSAGLKIKKSYPNAVAVKEISSNKISEKKDQVYYSLGKRDLFADLFFPRKLKNAVPAVILIHGGGWASGNKSHLVPLAQVLAQNGYFAATVEHRLSPEARYPAAITDIKTFVKWLKINSGKYNIDTTRIAILGCSAGATLASFVATTGQHSKFKSHKIAGQASDKVQALINVDGIVDFSDPNESGKDDNPEKPSAGARWFGATFKQNPDRWIEASPLTWVDENTPPVHFINSSVPRFHAGRDAFIKVMKQKGTFTEIYTLENSPHSFWLFHPWFDKTNQKILEFLGRIFG